MVAIRAAWIAVGLLAGGCAEPASSVAIAFGRDFAGFEEWTRFERDDPIPPSHPRGSVIYVDGSPPKGGREFPVGTRIVRIEGDGPEIHAMVKRGGGFNARGAVGWEFFELARDDAGTPWIVWRGEGPPNGDGYRPPDGGGAVLGCNHCHAAAPDNDSVLSSVLALEGP